MSASEVNGAFANNKELTNSTHDLAGLLEVTFSIELSHICVSMSKNHLSRLKTISGPYGGSLCVSQMVRFPTLSSGFDCSWTGHHLGESIRH